MINDKAPRDDKAQNLTPQGAEPSEIEALLPWHAVGTLGRRERHRVEDALRSDPGLAQRAELVREELAETIRLNETLGAPSAHALDRLMASIDAEAGAARRRSSFGAFASRFGNWIAALSPRTLAAAAAVAVLAIGLQGALLVGTFTSSQDGVSTGAQNGHGTFAMVRFARQASSAEITRFLESYQATLVDGPKPGGLYRVKLAVTNVAKEELAHIVARMRRERVVEFASASDD
jgi:anti-sigma-K factor RskA